MKKFLSGLALSAVLVSQAAVAAERPDRYFADSVFASKGACERALNRMRNENRQAGDMGRYITGDTYNAYVQWYFDCAEVGKNAWIVVRTR